MIPPPDRSPILGETHAAGAGAHEKAGSMRRTGTPLRDRGGECGYVGRIAGIETMSEGAGEPQEGRGQGETGHGDHLVGRAALQDHVDVIEIRGKIELEA